MKKLLAGFIVFIATSFIAVSALFLIVGPSAAYEVLHVLGVMALVIVLFSCFSVSFQWIVEGFKEI